MKQLLILDPNSFLSTPTVKCLKITKFVIFILFTCHQQSKTAYNMTIPLKYWTKCYTAITISL